MNRTIKFTRKNIFFYLLGFFVLGLGVILMLRANLGAGPWDTVTANLEALIDKRLFNVTLGQVSFVIAFIMMSVVLFYTRKWVLIGMVVPIGLVALSIDFWDLIALGTWTPSSNALAVLISFIGAVLIPLGLSFVIASHFPAFVFDELTIMLMNITRIKSMTIIRVGIEALGISLGTLFGFLAGIRFGAVGFASIIVVLMLPPLLEFFLKQLGELKDENTA